MSGLPDIWRHQWSSQKPTGHPAEKPVSLRKELVKQTPGELYCDPFMGSGTAGVACAQQGRAFIGIELDPRFFEMACKRIEAAYDQPDLFIEVKEPKQEQSNLLPAA
jgi:DNA modification methylase